LGRGGVEHDIEHCHFVSYVLSNLQLNIGKKYLKTAIIIDESLILAIVSCNNSTKPSYIFQLKRELKVWKYIFNLFHFEVLIQIRYPKFRSLSLFVLTFHEYKAVLCLVFGWIINCPCLSFCFASSCFVYYLCDIINI
jgi:hypothetical protein